MPELADVGEVPGDRSRHEHERYRAEAEHDCQHALGEEQLDSVARAWPGSGDVIDEPSDWERQEHRADHEKRRCVREQRQPRPGARGDRPGDEGPDEEADRAHRSTMPLARAMSREPASSGTSANSAACETATPMPSKIVRA